MFDLPLKRHDNSSMLSITQDSGLKISVDGLSFALPRLKVGNGSSEISMYRGNFKVKESRIRWNIIKPAISGSDVIYSGYGAEIHMSASYENGFLNLSFSLMSVPAPPRAGSWRRRP